MQIPPSLIKTQGGRSGQIHFGSLRYYGAKDPITQAEFERIFFERVSKEREQFNEMTKRQQVYMNSSPNNTSLKQFFDRTNKICLHYRNNFHLEVCAQHCSNQSLRISSDGPLHGISDNCYEFAVNDIFDSQGFHDKFHNPGDVSGNAIINKAADACTAKDYSSAIIADVEKKGYKCVEIKFDPNKPTYRNQTAVNIFHGVYSKEDYHFYKYDPYSGYWMHKPGITNVTCFDNSGMLILNPQQTILPGKSAYPYEIGFFAMYR